jgi:hypothetical protein
MIPFLRILWSIYLSLSLSEYSLLYLSCNFFQLLLIPGYIYMSLSFSSVFLAISTDPFHKCSSFYFRFAWKMMLVWIFFELNKNKLFATFPPKCKGQSYKTFYGCNLRIFVISWSVCPWQAFPAKSNVCR